MMRNCNSHHQRDSRNSSSSNSSSKNRGVQLQVPKGSLAIKVGREGEEEQQRLVVPITYLKHPLFLQLLKEAEDEYGFDHKGTITIPCRLRHFWYVKGLIDRDHHHLQSFLNHHHQHGHGHRIPCFRA